MELNKKYLKKMTYSFNKIANRIMRAPYDEYNIILEKFLKFIDDNELIMGYINIANSIEFDIKALYEEVVNSYGQVKFKFGPTAEEETFQIYKLLKYICENNRFVHYDMSMQYRGLSKYQDIVKQFNDRVVLVLINNIGEYLTKIGIDMGLDENINFNINGGQLNISNDNSTINANQNN